MVVNEATSPEKPSIATSNAAITVLWNRTFGGQWSNASSVQQTNDGGYIVAGTTYVHGNGDAAWLVKTDSQGNELWNRTFGVYDGWGASVQQTNDGGYIIATNKNIPLPHGNDTAWIIKTDPQGNELWNSTFDGLYIQGVQSILQTSNVN